MMISLRTRQIAFAIAVAALFGSALGGTRAEAQLTISPNGVLMKPGQTSGEVEVRNPSERPMVVTVRLMYAILRTDSTGAAFKDTVTTGAASERSAVDWMRAFPKQFTLAPGASRSVKVLATPPPDLADGEWLARLEIKGLPVDKPTQLEPDTTTIGVKLNYKYAYSFPAVFHKGTLTTAIEFDAAGSRKTEAGTAVMLRLRVSGNSTYRGTFFATLKRSDGGAPVTFEAPIVATVGYDFPLVLPELAPGVYEMTVRAATRKRGDTGNHLVTAPDVTKSFTLTLGEREVTVAAR